MDEEVSQRIRLARVLCIFFVVYAHTYIGQPQAAALAFDLDGAINLLKLILRDGFARVSVPLLGLISGYLAVDSYRKRGHRDIVRRKLDSLIYPMVLWSAAMLAVYAAAGLASGDTAFLREELPGSWLGWLNALLGISQAPFNGPLHFLRDVFVCFLLLPAFHALATRLPLLAVGLSGVLFFGEARAHDWLQLGPVPLFFRPTIPALFLFGMVIRSGYLAGLTPALEAALRRYLWVLLLAVCAFALWGSLDAAAPGAGGLPQIHPAGRLASLLLLWGMVIRLRELDIAAWLQGLSGLTFLVFCLHPLFEFVARQGLGTLFGWQMPGLLASAAYLAMPAGCFVTAWLMQRAMRQRLPGLLRLLSGNR